MGKEHEKEPEESAHGVGKRTVTGKALSQNRRSNLGFNPHQGIQATQS